MTWVIAQHGRGGPEVMRTEDREAPPPWAAQVRIVQMAIGFNFFDTLQRRGLISRDDDPGRVMGTEGAGRITAIGPRVTDVAIGDRAGYLKSPGAYAEARLIDSDLLFPLPDDVSFEVAAALTVKGFTAWLCAVRLFEVRRDQTVLVTTAAGGVGSLITRLASHRGADVIGAVGSEGKPAAARANGATEVAVGLGDVVNQVSRLTGGQGVDVIFDGIGADTAERFLDRGTVRTGGTIVSFGAGAGFPSAVPHAIARRGAAVLVPQVPNHIKTPDALRAGMAEVFALHRTGAFGDVSPTIYPLTEAASLHNRFERRIVSGISVFAP